MIHSSRRANHDKYFIDAVSNAFDMLAAFGRSDSDLTLTELAKSVGLSRSSAFRLLYTLEQKGWVERIDGGRKYRRLNGRRNYRIGYAMLSGQFPYSMNVSHGLQQAAERLGIELLVTDNCFSAEIALMNAQMFTKQGVDLVIECQVHEKMAPIIAHLLAQAAIPCIAIDIPQPGAVFFGANNYQAGLIAGHALGQYAATSWDGKFDKVLLLEAAQAGPIPQARLAGALHGIQEILGPISNTRVIRIDCRGTLRDSFALTNSVTNSLPHGSRVLIAALNDPSAVGAVRALEAAARTSEAAIVGQSATIEARIEMRRPGSCLIGSVGYFPEKYGEQIVPLAVKIIEGNPVLPAVYVEHIMVSPDNVDSLYPADAAVDATSERCLEMELINSPTTAPPQLLL